MSLHLTRKNQPELLDAALAVTQSRGWRDDAIAFGAMRGADGPVVAVGVFQGFVSGGFDRPEAEFHFGTAGRVTRGIIDAFKVLAFHERGMNLEKLWAPIAASNREALRAAIGCGFEFEYRKRYGLAGGEDAIVLSMARATGLASARPELKSEAT